MQLPPLEAFAHEREWQRWVAPMAAGDFDLAVPDDAGKPHEAAYAELAKAIEGLESHIEHSRRYIRAFCAAARGAPGDDAALVELSIGLRRGRITLYVTLNDPADLYGLWSVGLQHTAATGWWPVSFMRESW